MTRSKQQDERLVVWDSERNRAEKRIRQNRKNRQSFLEVIDEEDELEDDLVIIANKTRLVKK